MVWALSRERKRCRNLTLEDLGARSFCAEKHVCQLMTTLNLTGFYCAAYNPISLVSWWALLGSSLLHSTSWRGRTARWPPPQRRQVSPVSPALALSTALPHAGGWLNGVPSADLGLHLHDLCCSLRYWLGVPLHCTSYTCALNATAQQTGCGGNGDRTARHNAIRDVLYTLLPSLLPWSHLRRCPTSSPVPSPDRLTSTSPPGAVVALLPSISPLPPAADLG